MKSADYAALLKKYVNKIHLEPDEEIKQCVDDSFGSVYYCPYWAVTNHARVFSIRRYGLKELHPYMAHPKELQIQLKNSFSQKYVCLSRLVCVYFTSPEHFQKAEEKYRITPDMTIEERERRFRTLWHVHHIQKRDYENKSITANDSISNIIPLPDFIHKRIHSLIRTYQKDIWQHIWDVDHTITAGRWAVDNLLHIGDTPEPEWNIRDIENPATSFDL